MKSNLKRNMNVYKIWLMMMAVLLVNCQITYAHPLFYDDNNNPIEFNWANTSNGKRYLKIGYYNIHQNAVNVIPDVVRAWPSQTNEITAVQTNTAESNLDITTMSETEWAELMEYDEDKIRQTSAITVFSTGNGEPVIERQDALLATSREIIYAIIYASPTAADWNGDHDWKFILVHELGHALGLGHSNIGPNASSDASVMRSVLETPYYYLPQNHDITDIANKY